VGIRVEVIDILRTGRSRQKRKVRGERVVLVN